MRKYRLVAKKGEGTFSEVLKAQNVKDGKYHAIKCMKNRFDSIDQVNNLREIQALRRLSPHDHIIMLEEVLYDQPTGRLALVFELMDANLYELIKGRRHYLNPALVKSYMWQLMKSLDHMHKKGIFHRDIKPENILIESSNDVAKGLKLADFGSCRGIYSKQPYTEYISTRWYRAPECLLTDGYYGPEMDLWGAGCVMFEITSLCPLFPGNNEVDQINRIHKVVGTGSTEVMQKLKSKGASHISFDFPEQKGIGIAQLIPHATPECIDLIVKLLKYDATERISAREAMRHPYFKDIRESELKKSQTLEGSGNQSVVISGSKNFTGTDNGGAAQKGNNALSSNNSVSSVATQGSLSIPGGGNSVNLSNTNKGQGQAQQGAGAGASKVLPSLFQGQPTNATVPGNGVPGLHNSGNFVYDTSATQEKQPKQAKTMNNSSMLPQVQNANQQAAAAGSLPPIMGFGGMVSQGMVSQQSQKSIRSLQPPFSNSNGAPAAVAGNAPQKKKKKYRVNYGQRTGQNAEQVMRAYGVARNPSALESSSKILTTADIKSEASKPSQMASGSTYMNHPNRYYVQPTKKP